MSLLKELTSVSGITGYEEPIRRLLMDAWKPLTDEISTSRMGSLHALQAGSGKKPRHSVMVTAHMDAIGLIVTHIEDGLLRATGLGGVDPRVLPGQMVTVHTQEGDLPAMIVLPPTFTLDKQDRSGVVPLNKLWVDTGLHPRQAAQKVRVGDVISFSNLPVEIDNDYLIAHSLDNRVSLAVITETLGLLQKREHLWDVWAVATVQEENHLLGAQTSSFELRPSIAVVIDTTFASGPGAPGHLSFEMNGGPVFGWGPSNHPKLYREFEKTAKQIEIVTHKEVYTRSSGTDSDVVQLAGEGIPVMLIMIPIRYMHTPIEMASNKDIQRTARLIVELIAALDEDFLDRLRFDNDEAEN